MYLTASRIRDALACPLRYRRTYIEKIQDEKKAASMIFGDVVHRTIESFHNSEATARELSAKGCPIHMLVPSQWLEVIGEGELIDLIRSYQEYLLYAQVAEEQLVAFTSELIKAKPDIKSPTSTKAYREEKERLFAPFDEIVQQLDIKEKQVMESAPYRFSSKGPLKLYQESLDICKNYEAHWNAIEKKPDIIQNELKFTVELDEFTLSGKVDRIQVMENGDIEVIDYKTNQQKQSYLESFVQNAAYYYGVMHAIGITPNIMKYHYLRQGQEVSYYVDFDHVKKLAELMRMVREIHNLEAHNPSFNTCAWCSYFNMCLNEYGYLGEVL